MHFTFNTLNPFKKDTNFHVLIACECGKQSGLGHLFRSRALAEELCLRGVSLELSIRGTGPEDWVSKVDYPVHCKPPEDGDQDQWMQTLVESRQPTCVVMDFRGDLDPALVTGWKERGMSLVTIDDPSPKRFFTDLAFYPPHPRVEDLHWNGFRGKLFVGWKWVLLRREFSSTPTSTGNDPPVLLISAGGSDPAGITLQILSSLEDVSPAFQGRILKGPSFFRNEELSRYLRNSSKKYEVVHNPASVSEIMASSDLAVCAYGVTAHELAALGVPAIYIGLSQEHAEAASKLDLSGAGINLGFYSSLEKAALTRQVSDLLLNQSRRKAMSHKARELIDGRGARRIAREICRLQQN